MREYYGDDSESEFKEGFSFTSGILIDGYILFRVLYMGGTRCFSGRFVYLSEERREEGILFSVEV